MLIFILLFGVFLFSVPLIILGIVWQAKRAAENIHRLAASLGLQYDTRPPIWGVIYREIRARGQLRGKSVELFPFSIGAGKSRTQCCAVTATVPAGNRLTFHLRRQGFGTGVMELFGAQEVQTGDVEFDRAWFIQTNQPEFFRQALLPEVRARIMALVRETGVLGRRMDFRLDETTVRYSEVGSFAESGCCQRCGRAVEIVCDLADVAEVFAEQPPAN